MLKICISFIVLGAVFGYKQVVVQNGANESPEPFDELPCLTIGGICAKVNDCLDAKLSSAPGLCPVQQKSGVECCYRKPKSETSCQRNGGECVKIVGTGCPDILTYKEATDCEANEKCCILV